MATREHRIISHSTSPKRNYSQPGVWGAEQNSDLHTAHHPLHTRSIERVVWVTRLHTHRALREDPVVKCRRGQSSYYSLQQSQWADKYDFAR